MGFMTSGRGPHDADGFAPPTYGGPIAVKYGQVTYQNGAAAPATLFTLPKGAVIVGWMTNVVTPFNDSGTDVLDIGVTGTANRFADNLDVSSAGQIVTGYDDDELYVPLTGDTTVIGSYIGQNAGGAGAATEGAATVAVLYMLG